jgi:tetratricopeptide (TPR) repeat protein
VLLVLPLLLGQAAGPPVLDPHELAGRPDLVGREVIVEGREPRFDFSPRLNWYQFTFKGVPARFRLPDALALKDRPTFEAIRARGILAKEGQAMLLQVIAFEPLPPDRERLDEAVARLGANDAARRYDWARWGFARAKRYADDALTGRAAEVAADALRIEGEARENRAADRQIALAQAGRARGAAEPEPAALAHRGFRTRLVGLTDAAGARALAQEASAFFPAATRPVATPAPADAAPLAKAYETDPAAAYRQASPALRATLDRDLVADLLAAALERSVAEAPDQGVVLADRAAAELADRPEVARRLREQGLAAMVRDLGSLREADVRAIAARYEQELGQPDAGKALLRRWLEDQRLNRLSATDAEGRLLLADKYEAILADRRTAADLLREAARIDPDARPVVEALRRRGFRQVKGEWVAPAGFEPAPPEAVAGPDAGGATAAPAGGPTGDPYLGLSREEIRNQLGRPGRVVRVATQGFLLEQWQYRGLGANAQYFNFGKRPDQPRPAVVAHGRLD